jgi:hypothetical protein
MFSSSPPTRVARPPARRESPFQRLAKRGSEHSLHDAAREAAREREREFSPGALPPPQQPGR